MPKGLFFCKKKQTKETTPLVKSIDPKEVKRISEIREERENSVGYIRFFGQYQNKPWLSRLFNLCGNSKDVESLKHDKQRTPKIGK